MKRDWDLLRKQLIDVEEERDLRADILDKSKWSDEIAREKEENRQLGHLKLLIDGGLIEGIQVRMAMGEFTYNLAKPRLTMSGHDLLDTLRSSKVWDSIKSSAKDKSIELTFDSIKLLAIGALKTLIS